MTQLLGWSGTLFACLGALLMAMRLPASRYAYVCYLAANAALIAYAMLRADYPLLALNVGLTLISVLGAWRWLARREERGPIPVTLECERFARARRAMQATFGPPPAMRTTGSARPRCGGRSVAEPCRTAARKERGDAVVGTAGH